MKKYEKWIMQENEIKRINDGWKRRIRRACRGQDKLALSLIQAERTFYTEGGWKTLRIYKDWTIEDDLPEVGNYSAHGYNVTVTAREIPTGLAIITSFTYDI